VSSRNVKRLFGILIACALCFLVPQFRVLGKIGLIVVLGVILLAIYTCFLYWKSERFREQFDSRLKSRREWRKREKRAEQERLRLEKLKPKSLNIERTFSIQSSASFEVQYRLCLLVETSEGEFHNARLCEETTQTVFAEEYNQDVFHRFLRENSYRFHLGWKKSVTGSHLDQDFLAKADAFLEKEGEIFVRNVTSSEFEEKLRNVAFTKNGCRIAASEIVQNIFPEELIDRNYAMLSQGQREESERDERYSKFDEIVTVAALKRRLEFYRAHYRHSYDSSFVSIQTERIGSRLKIAWQFKKGALSGWDLVGFRKTGGFFPDQFDEKNNGTLIIHSQENNETTEFLREGETYFYTFYLKPSRSGDLTRYPVARFQITLTEEETKSIEATLGDLRRRVCPIPRRNISSKQKRRSICIWNSRLSSPRWRKLV
jgi:hypothetical protein